MSIKMLDCTLRDGAYITNSEFGDASIRGIISQMQKVSRAWSGRGGGGGRGRWSRC